MKTSIEWWNETKSNTERLHDWLKDQYHGEVMAAERINFFITSKLEDGWQKRIVLTIEKQEATHAEWIADLLVARKIEPAILNKEERYWDMVESTNDSPEYSCAIAAHAEEMRLERIKVIAEDKEAPEDIREVFKKILIQERFHAKAFKTLCGNKYYAETAAQHAKGLEALGLII